MTPKKAKLVMVGAFPPPVHGMALVNAAVKKALIERGVVPITIDLSAKSLGRSIVARLSRLPKVLLGIARFSRIRDLGDATLYMSISGGAAQLYEILFALIARRRGVRLVLHHHSYAYLDRNRKLTSWLVLVAGSDAVHVALSSGMADRLRVLYSVKSTTVVSNAAIFLSTPELLGAPRQRLRTLGFLGNIAPEKGVFEFLNLLVELRDRRVPIKAKLAGPFQDAMTEIRVREKLLALPDLEYVGPKYGAEKDQFFSDIDLLVFPTLYVNEAEPLTLHEAMIRGNPVVAYARGAIAEIVGADCGKVIDPSKPFVSEALGQIDTWLRDPASFREASVAAQRRCKKTYAENLGRWRALLDDLVGRDGELSCDQFVSEGQ